MTKAFRTFSRLLCPLLLSVAASDSSWAKDVRLAGMGVQKCSEWAAWKTSQNGEARAMTVEWAQGFLAGHNIYARTGDGTNPVIADTKTLAALLDNFCQKNPEERIVSGIIDITQSLGGARVNVAPKLPPNHPPLPPKNVPKDAKET